MDAYDVEKMQSFKRLGVKLQCITAFRDKLLLVTEGNNDLIEYGINNLLESKNKVASCFTYKVFDKPVTKMAAIPEINVLLVVSDNTLHVHSIQRGYELKSSLHHTRGLAHFDIAVEEYSDVVKKLQLSVQVKVCVTIGKRLKILEWNGESFITNIEDLVLSKPARGVLWCHNRIFVALKNEYIIVKPQTGEIKDVFAFGNEQRDPLMMSVSDDLVLLQYDTKSVFVNYHGKRAKEAVVSWTSIPNLMLHDPPYVVGLMSKHVEVKTTDPSISVQQMDIKSAAHICKGSSVIFIQTQHSVYTLTHRPREERIRHLVQNFHFDVAIQIQLQSGVQDATMEEMLFRIQSRKAVHLFCKRQFEESMNIFRKLHTDVSHIVGLIPELMPSKMRHHYEYPERVPSLQGNDNIRALRALADFLEERRDRIARQPGPKLDPTFRPIYQHKKNETLQTKEQALSVIDTTLLKCYLQINEAMVRPLLRKPENHVHKKVAEKVLSKNEKFTYLIVLYEQHHEEDKALAVMKAQSGKKKSPLYGVEPTVHKLQLLGEENLQLIFEYARWVFETDPLEGLKIFTEDLKTVKGLPRGHVFSYLSNISTDVAVDYLEHVIYVWGDLTSELHEEMAALLRDKVQDLYMQYRESQPQGQLPPLTDMDSMLTVCRLRFIKFLTSSKHYKPEDVLTRLPMDRFFEERAILLGNMGRHEQALGIYVYVLEDLRAAEDYCSVKYEEGHTEVYLHLLKVYLYPPGPLTLGLQDYKHQPEPRTPQAISMLETYAPLVNLYQAVEMLPDSMLLRCLGTFLEAAMVNHISRKLFAMVNKRVSQQDNLQVSYEKATRLCRTRVVIDDDTTCDICHLKIGKVVFARYPDGQLAHYYCFRRDQKTGDSSDDISTQYKACIQRDDGSAVRIVADFKHY